jgi:hypothetical protein
MMALSVFLVLGIISNFNFIFNPVVAPICYRNLHRQPVYHSTRLAETCLLVELYFETCVFSIELKSFEKALCYSAHFFVRVHLLSAIRFPQQHKKSTANSHTQKTKLLMHPLFRVPMVCSILLRHHLESAHQTPGRPHSSPPPRPPCGVLLNIHFFEVYPTFLQDSNFVDVSIIAMAS